MVVLAIKMLNQEINGLRKPTIFKYKHQMLMLIASFVIAFGFGGFTFFAISHGIGLIYGVLFIFLTLIYFLLAGVAIAAQSDILIDDQGISRRLLGKTWRTIQWSDIKVIWTFPVTAKGFQSKAGKGFAIYTSVKPIGISYLSGGIGFTDGFENMDQLIELINHYVSKHGIKIEIQANGVKTPANRL